MKIKPPKKRNSPATREKDLDYIKSVKVVGADIQFGPTTMLQYMIAKYGNKVGNMYKDRLVIGTREWPHKPEEFVPKNDIERRNAKAFIREATIIRAFDELVDKEKFYAELREHFGL